MCSLACHTRINTWFLGQNWVYNWNVQLYTQHWYTWRRTDPCNLHAGARKSCTVYPWKSAWFSIRALERPPLVPLTKDTPCKLKARSRNHALYTPRKVRDVPTLGIQLDSPLRYRTPLTKNTPSKLKARSRNHALYTPGRVHDLRSVP